MSQSGNKLGGYGKGSFQTSLRAGKVRHAAYLPWKTNAEGKLRIGTGGCREKTTIIDAVRTRQESGKTEKKISG